MAGRTRLELATSAVTVRRAVMTASSRSGHKVYIGVRYDLEWTAKDSSHGMCPNRVSGYSSFAYSDLACFRIGMSGSAVFQDDKEILMQNPVTIYFWFRRYRSA